MKHDRPSFRVYKAHIYRQYFGRSLSAKPVTDKNGESYAVLKSMPYKLFLIIYFPLILILMFSQGFQFGFIPILAGIVLYFLIATVRYFFAKFVKIKDSVCIDDSEYIEDPVFISYEMCDYTSRNGRPKFPAYLKYIFVPARRRYIHLIKDEDGREYYPAQRQYYPESFLFSALGYLVTQIGLIMGTVFVISAFVIIGILILLLSPLTLYYLRFKITDNQETDDQKTGNQGNTVLHKEESLLYKIVSGVFIAACVAVFVLTLIFRLMFSFEYEEINLVQPQTIVQTYDSVHEYASERFGKADIVGFYIEYGNLSTMQMGEPSMWQMTFQNTPGLLPRPNETLRMGYNGKNTDVFHKTYEIITPTYDAWLVTDPYKIMGILMSKNGALSDLNIKHITITTPDFSLFRIHNPEECMVDIECERESMRYIVNIKDKTARLI